MVFLKAALSQCIRLEELKENLKEAMPIAGSRAKMFVAISCDVCKPEDVSKLASFVVEELGSVDFWVNNAGINKGFRPLLQFTVEDIVQGKLSSDPR